MSAYDGAGEVVAFSPSRENAAGALDMIRSFYQTVHRVGTEVIVVIDEDDPQREDYLYLPGLVKRELVGMGITRPDPPRIMVVEGGSLTKATNEGVERIWDADIIIGHVGDDHRFITPGWDNRIRDAILGGAAVAYAYDGFKSAWASAWWTPAIVPRTLGWLALPGSRHLTIDDAFMDIGAGLGRTPGERLVFLEDVLIEHLHPAGGKVPWRDIVKSHYAKPVRALEDGNLQRWRLQDFAEDIALLRDALHLPHYPVIDTAPGIAFRKAMGKAWHIASPVPTPSDEELQRVNGGVPVVGLPARVRVTNIWMREWRAAHPGWDE